MPESQPKSTHTFETTRISELAERHPDLAKQLSALNARIIDPMSTSRPLLSPSTARQLEHQERTASICARAQYADLDGVQEGTLAVLADQEAIDQSISRELILEIERQLRQYRQLNTYSTVKI